MGVFSTINDMTADEVLNRLNLPMANDGKSYVCPLCGNGTHGDARHGNGDGIKPKTNSSGRTRWKCFRCGKNFSNVELAGAVLGINVDNDKARASKELAELFGISDSFSFEGDNFMDEKKSASTNEPKNYAKFYQYCRSNLPAFVEAQGGAWRGLTYDTLFKHGCGYAPKFGKDKTPHVIFQYDDYHYFARAVEGNGRGHHGEIKRIYEVLPISTTSPNIIVEGEIDALSVAQVLNSAPYGVLTAGSASNYSKVVPELEKRFGNVDNKPSFIVMFDNDSAGSSNGEELVKLLRQSGYPAVLSFFEGQGLSAPKVDANDLLQRSPKELANRLLDVVDTTDKDLRQQAAEFAEKNQQAEVGNRPVVFPAELGIVDFPMGDYFANHYAADVEQTSRYADRRTGFDNLDGAGKFEREGQKLFLLPGLYMLGATPGAGKTTFAWQLLNQLAEQGEPCVFCSYEMSRAELYAKTIAAGLFKRKRAGENVMLLSAADIRRGACKGIAEVNDIVSSLAQTSKNLHLLEISGANVEQLIEALKCFTSTHKPPVIVIDYLQIIPPISTKATAKEKVDDVMLKLKSFQRDTSATLIVISALNREGTKGVESPALSAFRESSSIEYSCDVALTIAPLKDEDMKRNPRPLKLICQKNRNGALFDCSFNYYARSDYFEPCDDKNHGEAYDAEDD